MVKTNLLEGQVRPVEGQLQNKLRSMVAMICFSIPEEMNRAIADLLEHDCAVVQLDDLVDDFSPATWVEATAYTELGEIDFFDWVSGIVGDNGLVLEAGLSSHCRPLDARRVLS
jgi:hypothetical protein